MIATGEIVTAIRENLEFYVVSESDFRCRESSQLMVVRLLADIGNHHCALRYLDRLRRWMLRPSRKIDLRKLGKHGEGEFLLHADDGDCRDLYSRGCEDTAGSNLAGVHGTF